MVSPKERGCGSWKVLAGGWVFGLHLPDHQAWRLAMDKGSGCPKEKPLWRRRSTEMDRASGWCADFAGFPERHSPRVRGTGQRILVAPSQRILARWITARTTSSWCTTLSTLWSLRVLALGLNSGLFGPISPPARKKDVCGMSKARSTSRTHMPECGLIRRTASASV